MYSKVVPTLFILSSLLVPTLSLAIPQRAELERRDLGAGSVENLEAREPLSAAGRNIFRAARKGYNIQQRYLPGAFSGRNRGPLIARVRNAFANVRRFMPAMGRSRIRARDLGDLEDLTARDIIENVLELEARDLGDFEELDARSLVDEEDDLVLRSLVDELDDLEARALFDDQDDLEAREIVESLDELD